MIYFVNPVAHPNIGDIAIFYSTYKLLSTLRQPFTIVNQKTHPNLSASESDTILLLGGGWLGIYDCSLVDYYMSIALKNQHANVIFLPSSFAPLKQSYKCLKNIKATFFARDPISFQYYNNEFSHAKVLKCNDLVFYLPRINFSPTVKSDDIGFYTRDDVESNHDINKVVTGTPISRFTKTPIPYAINHIKQIEYLLATYTYTMIQKRIIVTDTLHMSIFAYLLHKPCIYFDNVYGKLNNTWSQYNQRSALPYDAAVGLNIASYNFDTSISVPVSFSELLAHITKVG